MEKQFFTWEDWELLDTASMFFTECTLTASIGDHPVGAEFDGITMNYETGQMTLQREDEETEEVIWEETYTLALTATLKKDETE